METRRQFDYNYYLSDDKQSVVFVNGDDVLKKELQRLNIKLHENKISLEEFKRLRSVHLQPQPFHDMFPGLEGAIDYVWENYLKYPFKQKDIFSQSIDNFRFVAPDKKSITLIEIPRPNHGIVHTLRVAALIPILVVFFQLHANPDCQKMLDRYDMRTIKFLQLAALFSIVGRLDETGFLTEVAGAKEKYLEYRKASAEAFEKYCRAKQNELGITDEEIDHYKFVVLRMGNPDETVERNNLIRRIIELQSQSMKEGKLIELPEENLFDFLILHLSHCLDLFRCREADMMHSALKQSDLFTNFLVGDYQKDFDKLVKQNIELIIVTGDRLMSDYKGEGKFEDVNIPYNTAAYAVIALDPKKAISVINDHLTQNPESALEDLMHGPRQKTQATQDLEKICKALLSPGKKIACTRNILDEVEVNMDGEIFNLSEILKYADFEQLELSEAEISAYANFLAQGHPKYKPLMKGASKEPDFFPSEQDYKKRDPTGIFDHLSYSEKLAITLYSGNHVFEKVNKFLRNNAMLHDSEANELTEHVKEILLVAAIATSGLNKTKKVAPLNQDYWQKRYQTTYRLEIPSEFHTTRQSDMEVGRTTLQRGFTSMSEKLDTGLESKDKIKMHSFKKIWLTIPQGDLPKGYWVRQLCWSDQEEEVMLPPGAEIKFYKRIQYAKQDVMYGVPVRTIASEQHYAYGTEIFRKKRRELLEIISDQLTSPLVSSARVSMDEYSGIADDLFYQAIDRRHFAVAAWLFEHGVNPAPRTGDNYDDFILFCCQKDQADIIEKYWERKSLKGNVILSEAILYGSKKVVERLLEKFPNELDLKSTSLSVSPLHTALRVKSEEMLRLLLAKGANIEVYGDANQTPLEYAVDRVEKNDWEWVKMLIASGANVTDRLVGRAVSEIMLRTGDNLFFNILTPKTIEKIEEYFKYTPRFAKPEPIQYFYITILRSEKFDSLGLTIQLAIFDAISRLNKEIVNKILHRLLAASLFKPVIYLLLKVDFALRDFDKHNFAFYANAYPTEVEDFMINAISAMPLEEALHAIEKLRDPISTIGGLFSSLGQPDTRSLLFRHQSSLSVENIIAKLADKQIGLTKPKSPD